MSQALQNTAMSKNKKTRLSDWVGTKKQIVVLGLFFFLSFSGGFYTYTPQIRTSDANTCSTKAYISRRRFRISNFLKHQYYYLHKNPNTDVFSKEVLPNFLNQDPKPL